MITVVEMLQCKLPHYSLNDVRQKYCLPSCVEDLYWMDNLSSVVALSKFVY